MKKAIPIITGTLLLLCTAPTGAEVYGPFFMNVSNTLPDGHNYAGVTIDNETATLADYTHTCTQGRPVALVTATPMTAILDEGTNFGIQSFGLNYRGDPEELDVLVMNDPEADWNIAINYDSGSSFGPFGIFVYEGSSDGSSRMNPLELLLCYKGPGSINVYDFYEENKDRYIFTCHIADFTYAGSGTCADDDEQIECSAVDSALFALPVPVPPTLIELSAFEVIAGNSRVVVVWTTDCERENAGFNLYRAAEQDGDYIKINGSLIPAEGAPAGGGSYSFTDDQVQNRRTYWYKLEDVDINGLATMHGPRAATPRFIHGVLNQ